MNAISFKTTFGEVRVIRAQSKESKGFIIKAVSNDGKIDHEIRLSDEAALNACMCINYLLVSESIPTTEPAINH